MNLEGKRAPGAEPQVTPTSLLRPHVGRRLTQGALFSCAKAEQYEGCEVHGIVLTARCDLSQDKVPVTNYVPVVRFDDWLHRDFFALLCDRCESDVNERFDTFLDNHELARSLLIANSPRQIVEIQFPEEGADRIRANARKKGLDIVGRLESISTIRALPAEKKPVVELAKAFEGIRARLIKDCVHQGLFGYYFLPSVSVEGDARGYVALLREVHHLPTACAHAIGEGLDSAAYEALQKSVPQSAGLLAIPVDGMAHATAVLQSPFVEHLLQVFGMLFGRIGLPDPDETYVSRLWSEQPSIKGSAQ